MPKRGGTTHVLVEAAKNTKSLAGNGLKYFTFSKTRLGEVAGC